MKNLILGLGGTGAKIVESFVHLCAAGLGPAEAGVAFIDQDKSNGNTHRARTALAAFAAAQRALRGPGGRHSGPPCDLFRTRLDPYPDETRVESCHWVPQRERDVELAKLIDYNLQPDRVQGLARAFFHEREELRMPLNEGYRGRPHVGSAAFLTHTAADGFRGSLEDVVRHASEEVRVFLCGSVFGGTGAAILPTLARQLRHVAGETGRPLRTAGALMLPYFTFGPGEDRNANTAIGHELLLQSQSALSFYRHEMERDDARSFDELYLVGWSPPIELNYHEAGGGPQANPPLAPELFGALAAARFFRRDDDGGSGGGDRGDRGPRLHVIARAEPNSLDWADLPAVIDGASPAAAYASWLPFCALWRFNYARAFDADRRPRGVTDEAWFRRFVGDLDGDPALGRAVGALDAYVEAALRYAAALSAFSIWDGDAGFNLWAHGPIAAVDRKELRKPPDLDGGTLAREAREGLDLRSFKNLVSGFPAAPDAADVFWALAAKKPASPGLWPLVANLHECAAPPNG